MGEIIKRAISSAILLPIILLSGYLFSGISNIILHTCIIASIILIFFIAKPFRIKNKINKAKELITEYDYVVVIDGITKEKNMIDAQGITARKYYVNKINAENGIIYLNTYK